MRYFDESLTELTNKMFSDDSDNVLLHKDDTRLPVKLFYVNYNTPTVIHLYEWTQIYSKHAEMSVMDACAKYPVIERLMSQYDYSVENFMTLTRVLGVEATTNTD